MKARMFLRSLACFPFELWKRIVSPLLGERCRFYPSCSDYGRQAVMQHGVFKGLLITLRRLLRCNPLCAGGHDPVPSTKKN